jgi:hypothetical protein
VPTNRVMGLVSFFGVQFIREITAATRNSILTFMGFTVYNGLKIIEID